MPTEEGTHQIGDMSLYTKTWKPDGPPKAILVFVHGYSDHINRYNRVYTLLAQAGIETHGFDQRGWGRSVHKPAEKGLTGPTTLVISDIVSFLKTVLPSSVPVFVLGHSMGGGEVCTLISDPNYADLMESIRGWLLESPFIAFPKGYEPGVLKVFLGRLAGRLLPHRQLYERLPPENLTRDPETQKSMDADPLLHNTGTLEGLAGMLDRCANLQQGKFKVNKGVRSIWVGHGSEDKGTSYEWSKRWYEENTTAVQDRTFKTYEGWFHILHDDGPGTTEEYAQDISEWILARCGKEGQSTSTSKL